MNTPSLFSAGKSNTRKGSASPAHYLSIKEVMIEHVVVTELILAVELGVSET